MSELTKKEYLTQKAQIMAAFRAAVAEATELDPKQDTEESLENAFGVYLAAGSRFDDVVANEMSKFDTTFLTSDDECTMESMAQCFALFSVLWGKIKKFPPELHGPLVDLTETLFNRKTTKSN